MRKVEASEAQTHLPELLDEVERGETLVILRDGRAMARLVPEPAGKREDIRRAIAEMKAAGKAAGKITAEELISARDEGRRI
jgi:antitoxin (DNA-binding transcriptional repressor) of toxin-antitoxin stability system